MATATMAERTRLPHIGKVATKIPIVIGANTGEVGSTPIVRCVRSGSSAERERVLPLSEMLRNVGMNCSLRRIGWTI